jgi:cobalt-zinc-cadmium efflux system outer membrane protein
MSGAMPRLALAAAGLVLLLGLAGQAAARPPRAAEAPAVAPLSMAAAERLLVERNLALLAARRGVDAARAQRLVASSPPPPEVSLGTNLVQGYERRPAEVRMLTPADNLTLGLSVVVERGGKRMLRTRLAEEQIGVAEALVLDTLRQQVFALRKAFLGALLARAKLEVALANRTSLDRTEALLRRQAREGQIPEGDLIRLQASRPVFEAAVAAARQAEAGALAELAALLGADATARPGFEISGRLDRTPGLGLSREQLAEAAAQRADVVAAARQAAAAAANRALAEAARSRDVTLGLNLGRGEVDRTLSGGAGQRVVQSQAGVSVSVPIFTSRIVEGNVGLATAQQAQAEAQARAALLQARADVAAAWAAYEQARALLSVFDGGALRRAEEAYAIAERAYLAGGRSLVEVLDALRTLNETRIAASEARHAYLLALAELERASGVSGVAARP